MSIVTLPQGAADDQLGISFGGGSPPQFAYVDPKSPLSGQVSVGQYCHGISLPGVDIVQLQDPSHLMNLIRSNQHSERRELMISNSPTYIDPSVLPSYQDPNASRSVLYKHTLPTMEPLGVFLTGFPPYISRIDPNSKLHGALQVNQTVQALVIPGQEVFHLQSGGFTNGNVIRRLDETSHIPGRQLVVKDVFIGKRTAGSNAATDDCCVIS